MQYFCLILSFLLCRGPQRRRKSRRPTSLCQRMLSKSSTAGEDGLNTLAATSQKKSSPFRPRPSSRSAPKLPPRSFLYTKLILECHACSLKSQHGKIACCTLAKVNVRPSYHYHTFLSQTHFILLKLFGSLAGH
jgi:hypothetical protein